jgi:hypothetical protein
MKLLKFKCNGGVCIVACLVGLAVFRESGFAQDPNLRLEKLVRVQELVRSDQMEEALQGMEELKEDPPPMGWNSKFYGNLATLHTKLNQREQAQAALLRAISLEPHLSHWRLELNRAATSEDDPKAFEFLDEGFWLVSGWISKDNVTLIAQIFLWLSCFGWGVFFGRRKKGGNGAGWASLLAALGLFFSFWAGLLIMGAETRKVGVVSKETGLLRSDASPTALSLNQVPPGTILWVGQESNGWLLVESFTGQKGWMAKNQLQIF